MLEVIKKFNRQINEETNQTTGIPPVVLMKKEIEHLQPIPNKILMDTYIQDVNVQKCRKHCLSHIKAMDTQSAKN